MQLSRFADSISTSPILTIAAEINARQQRGESLHNLTVGDFDADIFAIPEALTCAVIKAYRAHQTNYPGAAGVVALRNEAAALATRLHGVECAADEIIIAGGSRPLIYALYRTVVNPGERVVYPVPSWNNEAYAAMVGAAGVGVDTTAQNHFMPSAESLAEAIDGAALLALCSPQNPTGTVFATADLQAIGELVVAENRRRGAARPLYVLFDQVYSALTFGDAFRHPLTVCPALREYAIFIDGMSKAFAATGVRVGWAAGPPPVVAKMSSLIAHIGAWAPKPEQTAAAHFLADHAAVDHYLAHFRDRLAARLQGFHAAFMALKNRGHAVHAIAPQGAIYLSVRIDIQGKKTPAGAILNNADAVQRYLLDEARIGLLPFPWFGAKNHDNWFRLSVGACRREQIPAIMTGLEAALNKLH